MHYCTNNWHHVPEFSLEAIFMLIIFIPVLANSTLHVCKVEEILKGY